MKFANLLFVAAGIAVSGSVSAADAPGAYQTASQSATGVWTTSGLTQTTEERALAVAQRDCLDRRHPGVVPNKASMYVNTLTGRQVLINCIEYRARAAKPAGR